MAAMPDGSRAALKLPSAARHLNVLSYCSFFFSFCAIVEVQLKIITIYIFSTTSKNDLGGSILTD